MVEPVSQREYWGGRVGAEWAARADQTDAMLGGVADAAFARAAFKAGERVLDIGCGAGATSVEIARRVSPGGFVLGVDISPQLLTVARQRASAGNVEFVEADAATLAADANFDVAFSRFGVMFFEDPAPAFAHIRSLLRPAGRLVFACWRTLEENGWATAPIAAIAPMLAAPLAPTDADAPGPFAFADSSKIKRILAEAGWRGVEVTRWDGDIPVGGCGELQQIGDFVLRIGPCARAIADQMLDAGEAKRRLLEYMAPLYRDGAVRLPAACWLASANP